MTTNLDYIGLHNTLLIKDSSAKISELNSNWTFGYVITDPIRPEANTGNWSSSCKKICVTST